MKISDKNVQNSIEFQKQDEEKSWYLRNPSVFATDFIGSSHGVFLMRAKKESKKPGLKLNIQKTKCHHRHLVPSGTITLWTEGEKWEQ